MPLCLLGSRFPIAASLKEKLLRDQERQGTKVMKTFIVAVLSALVFPFGLKGQGLTSLNGTVTDPSGGVVPWRRCYS
jgi:hypothetical protein